MREGYGVPLGIVSQRLLGAQGFGSTSSHCPDRGPLKVLAPALRTAPNLAAHAILGLNGAGKSRFANALIMQNAMTDAEYEQELVHLEPMQETVTVYEEGYEDFDEEPSLHGRPLLSDAGYCAPVDVSDRVRGKYVLPKADMDHGTRIATAITHGRPCLVLVHRTRREVYDTMEYLDSSRLRSQDPPGNFNHQRLRLGLELIEKRVKKSKDGDNTLLEAVFALRAEDICIPSKCWQDAGTVTRFYPDSRLPLEQQQQQLSKAVWKMTTLVAEDEGAVQLAGSHHVPFLSAALVTYPCSLLKDMLLIDCVGYIPGDAACEDAHSQLPKFAANTLVCPSVREEVVHNSLTVAAYSRSKLLQLLAIRERAHSAPPLLLLVPAERITEQQEAGDRLVERLATALDSLAVQGDAAAIQHLAAALPAMLLQFHSGLRIDHIPQVQPGVAEQPDSARTAATQSVQLLESVQGMLNARHRLQNDNLAWYAKGFVDKVASRIDAAIKSYTASGQVAGPGLEEAAMAAALAEDSDDLSEVTDDDVDEGSEEEGWPADHRNSAAPTGVDAVSAWQQLRNEHNITPLGWYPATFASCKQLLLSYKQQLQQHGLNVEELVAQAADMTGVTQVMQHLRSSKERFQQQGHAAEVREVISRLDREVPDTLDTLQSLMLAKLQTPTHQNGAAATASQQQSTTAAYNHVLSGIQQAQLGGEPHSQWHSDTCAALQAAVAEWQEPHLDRCTAKRGFAEGVRMIVTDERLSRKVPNWRDQLDVDNNDKLVGPEKYDEQLKRLLQGRKLHLWLLNEIRHLKISTCSDPTSSSNSSSNNIIVKGPAACILTPISMLSTQQAQRVLTLPSGAQMQQLQHQQELRRATAVDLARLQLGKLCVAIQTALKLPDGTDVDQQLAGFLLRKQEEAVKVVAEAFHIFSDLISFQEAFLLADMEETLSCSLLNILAGERKSTFPKKLELVQQCHTESITAVQEAVKAIVAEHVDRCWAKLVSDFEAVIFRPVCMWPRTREQMQQLAQQTDLCDELRDAAVLKCYMASRALCRTNGHADRVHALEPASALPPALMEIAGKVVTDPDRVISALHQNLRPTRRQLRAVATALHSVAAQLPGAAAISVKVLLEQTVALKACAEQLPELQPHPEAAGILKPLNVLALWLWALPASVTVEQLLASLHQPENISGTSSGSTAGNAAMIVGSEGHFELVEKLLLQGKLPWKLSETKELVRRQIEQLPGKMRSLLLMDRAISALPELQLGELAQYLYARCYGYKDPVYKLFNHTFVDALVLPKRLRTTSASAAHGAGSSSGFGGALAASGGDMVPDAAAVLLHLPSKDVYHPSAAADNSRAAAGSNSNSTGVPPALVRIVSKPLPAARSGKVGGYVTLPVHDDVGRQFAELPLGRCDEYWLCLTRVTSGSKMLLQPTSKQLEVLNQRAPPMVLLAALHLLQTEAGWRQLVQGTASSNSVSGQLLLPRVQEADRLLGRILEAADVVAGGSSSSSSLPPERLQRKQWDVCETKGGSALFVYNGPWPSGLVSPAAAAAGAAGISSTELHPLVLDKPRFVTDFVKAGALPSPGYLSQKKHKRLLCSIGYDSTSTAAAGPSQGHCNQSGSPINTAAAGGLNTSAGGGAAAAAAPNRVPATPASTHRPPAAAAGGAAAAAGVGGRHSQKGIQVGTKRRATTAGSSGPRTRVAATRCRPAAVADTTVAAASDTDEGHDDEASDEDDVQDDEFKPRSPPVKRVRSSAGGGKRVNIGDLVQAGLLTAGGAEVYVTKKRFRDASAQKCCLQLSTQGAIYKSQLLNSPCALGKEVIEERIGWQSIFAADGTCWKTLKDELERRRNRARKTLPLNDM